MSGKWIASLPNWFVIGLLITIGGGLVYSLWPRYPLPCPHTDFEEDCVVFGDDFNAASLSSWNPAPSNGWNWNGRAVTGPLLGAEATLLRTFDRQDFEDFRQFPPSEGNSVDISATPIRLQFRFGFTANATNETAIVVCLMQAPGTPGVAHHNAEARLRLQKNGIASLEVHNYTDDSAKEKVIDADIQSTSNPAPAPLGADEYVIITLDRSQFGQWTVRRSDASDIAKPLFDAVESHVATGSDLDTLELRVEGANDTVYIDGVHVLRFPPWIHDPDIDNTQQTRLQVLADKVVYTPGSKADFTVQVRPPPGLKTHDFSARVALRSGLPVVQKDSDAEFTIPSLRKQPITKWTERKVQRTVKSGQLEWDIFSEATVSFTLPPNKTLWGALAEVQVVHEPSKIVVGRATDVFAFDNYSAFRLGQASSLSPGIYGFADDSFQFHCPDANNITSRRECWTKRWLRMKGTWAEHMYSMPNDFSHISPDPKCGAAPGAQCRSGDLEDPGCDADAGTPCNKDEPFLPKPRPWNYWRTLGGNTASSRDHLASLLDTARDVGVKAMLYTNGYPSGPPGMEFARRHPEWLSYQGSGSMRASLNVRTLGETRDWQWKEKLKLPSPFKSLKPSDPPLQRVYLNFYDEQWPVPLAVLDRGIEEVVRATQEFRFQGIRFDGHWLIGGASHEGLGYNIKGERPNTGSAGIDGRNLAGLKYVRKEVRNKVPKPDFEFGYNYGLDYAAQGTRSPNTYNEAAADSPDAGVDGGIDPQKVGGAILYEFAGQRSAGVSWDVGGVKHHQRGGLEHWRAGAEDIRRDALRVHQLGGIHLSHTFLYDFPHHEYLAKKSTLSPSDLAFEETLLRYFYIQTFAALSHVSGFAFYPDHPDYYHPVQDRYFGFALRFGDLLYHKGLTAVQDTDACAVAKCAAAHCVLFQDPSGTFPDDQMDVCAPGQGLFNWYNYTYMRHHDVASLDTLQVITHLVNMPTGTRPRVGDPRSLEFFDDLSTLDDVVVHLPRTPVRAWLLDPEKPLWSREVGWNSHLQITIPELSFWKILVVEYQKTDNAGNTLTAPQVEPPTHAHQHKIPAPTNPTPTNNPTLYTVPAYDLLQGHVSAAKGPPSEGHVTERGLMPDPAGPNGGPVLYAMASSVPGTCGGSNPKREYPEECDVSDDTACPGACRLTGRMACTCPADNIAPDKLPDGSRRVRKLAAGPTKEIPIPHANKVKVTIPMRLPNPKTTDNVEVVSLQFVGMSTDPAPTCEEFIFPNGAKLPDQTALRTVIREDHFKDKNDVQDNSNYLPFSCTYAPDEASAQELYIHYFGLADVRIGDVSYEVVDALDEKADVTGLSARQGKCAKLLVVRGLWHERFGFDEAVDVLQKKPGYAQVKREEAFVRLSETTTPVADGFEQFLGALGQSLLQFDAIALLNVPAASLRAEGRKYLAQYAHAGGTLIVAGGASAFGHGGYKGTALEKVLPVTVTKHFDLAAVDAGAEVIDCYDKPCAGEIKSWADAGTPRGAWYHHVQLQTTHDAKTLLEIDGAPFLSRSKPGAGTVYALTGTPLGEVSDPVDAWWGASAPMRQVLVGILTNATGPAANPPPEHCK